MVFSNIEVGDKHAGPSGHGDLEVTKYITGIRRGPLEGKGRSIRPPGNDGSKIHA